MPVSIFNIAEGEKDTGRAEDENDAIVQDRFARAFLICKQLRPIQRQIEADLIQECDIQQVQQQRQQDHTGSCRHCHDLVFRPQAHCHNDGHNAQSRHQPKTLKNQDAAHDKREKQRQ